MIPMVVLTRAIHLYRSDLGAAVTFGAALDAGVAAAAGRDAPRSVEASGAGVSERLT
jgi:hypothetical protein